MGIAFSNVTYRKKYGVHKGAHRKIKKIPNEVIVSTAHDFIPNCPCDGIK
jgi:hypothetical protein